MRNGDLSWVGLGTWRFAPYGWRTTVDFEAARSIIAYALDHGVSWFDTAPSYGSGRAERILGSVLPRGVPVVTKIAPVGAGPIRERVLRCQLAASLRRLGVGRPVTLLVHHPCGTLEASLETWRRMAGLANAGWVASIGLSNAGYELVAAANEIHPVQLVQNDAAPTTWTAESTEAAEAMRQLGSRFVGYGVLAHGLLRDEDLGAKQYPGTDWRSGGWGVGYYDEHFAHRALHARASMIRQLKKEADCTERSIVEHMIHRAAGNPSLDHIVVGASSVRQICDLLRYADDASSSKNAETS